VTTPSAAAAVAALGDVEHVQRSVEHNRKWLPWLTNALRERGVEVLPSGANFVLARFPGEGWKQADAKLRAKGIIARALPGLSGVRISVGLEQANRDVVAALSQ
jgi:histidinol-phosphate aminotransferase